MPAPASSGGGSGLLTVVWLLYSTSWVATNVYIAYWLTHYRGWTGDQAGRLLLICGGIGFSSSISSAAWLGERWGRREVLVWTGIITGPLNLLFMFMHTQPIRRDRVLPDLPGDQRHVVRAGYAYWAECFPTRVRGTAVGWLGAMFTLGLIIGTALWTILISVTTPAITWFIIAVVLGFGQWTALLLPKIEPGQTLEAIAT